MKAVYIYKRPLISAILISPLALGLWWLLLWPVILPLIKVVAGTFLELIFGNLDLKIVAQDDKDWLITTNLLIEPAPYSGTLQTHLHLAVITLGLPILWTFCLVFYRKSIVPNIIFGSGYLILLTSVAVILKGVYTVYSVMAFDGVINQYLPASQLIVPIETISDFKLHFLLIAGNVVNYIVIFVFPLSWCYYVNKDSISALLSSRIPLHTGNNINKRMNMTKGMLSGRRQNPRE